MRKKFNKGRKKDIVNEILLIPLLCLAIYAYCVTMLLIISFITYSFFAVSLEEILIISGIITALFLLYKIIRLVINVKK